MELHQLRYAVAVVDQGTFTAAAAACFVAQPSLSQAVRQLERELGAELFARIGRRVRLTAAGEAFVPAAREALRAVETVRAEVAAVSGLVAGRLDLVALPTLAVDPVTPLVGAFREVHPGVTVRLAHPDGAGELLDAVLSGASEIGLTEMPVRHERLVAHPLGRQEVVAVLPPGSAPATRMTVRELARLPLVTLPSGTSTRGLLDRALAAAGTEPVVAVESDQREVLVPLVLAGAGAAVLPRPMAAEAALRGAVVVPLHPPLWRDLCVVHRDAVLSPAARAFLHLALGAAAAGRVSAASGRAAENGM